ncbi:MAG TPA: SPFH domain-containing protein [Byssovorax sp.]|jgi:hypothetical protein
MRELMRPEAGGILARVRSVPVGGAVIVAQEDVVVLEHDGAAVETLGPGRHELTPEALPAAAQLAFGDVFDAEAWFIRTAPLFGVKVGGPAGELLDRVTNVYVRPRFSAEVAVRAADPARLVAALASGGLPDEDDSLLAFVRQQVLEAARRTLASVCAQGTASLADVDAIVALVAEQLPLNLADLDDLGLSVGAFSNIVVMLTPDDAAALAAARGAGAESRVRAIHCPRCGAAARGVYCTQCGGPV